MLNKAEKAVEQYKLDQEKAVLKKLELHYEYALNGINERLHVLQAAPETQSKVYQKQYQKTLKKQVSAILENLRANEYATLDQYMHDAYTTGFVGTMYDLHHQGVPLLIPINQSAILKAVQHDTKLTHPLYDELGIDTKRMSRFISREISRGIASGLTYDEVARNIKNVTKAPLSRAKVIARTEGHRIQQASSQDAAEAAKAKGADIVKQWDSTLDGDTRPNHRQLDGQIRELDEPFAVGGYSPMYPGDFGDPGEDCNCRCVSLKRARAALDEDELKTLKERAEFFELDNSDSFADFEKKYLKASEEAGVTVPTGGNVTPTAQNVSAKEAGTIEKSEKNSTIDDDPERVFDEQERAALAEIEGLEKQIKDYDDALREIERKTDETVDFAELVKLSEESDEIAQKRNTASSKLSNARNVLDDIRRNKDWHKFEKPFSKLTTVQEVEAAMDSAGWFSGKVSLGGCPVGTAKSVAASFNRVFSTYPEMKGLIRGVSTEPLGISAWAGFVPATQRIVLGSATFSGDVKWLKRKYADKVAAGHFPKGTDYRSILVHEMGHAVDYFVGKKKGVERISYTMQYEYLVEVVGLKSEYSKTAIDYIATHVSNYGKTNQKELFAECFSEYLTSPHPREMATWYGERTKREIKGALGSD